MAGKAIDADETTSSKHGRCYSPQMHGDEGLVKPSLADTEYGLDETKEQMHKRGEAIRSNSYPKKETKCFRSFVWDMKETKCFYAVFFLGVGIWIKEIVIGVGQIFASVITQLLVIFVPAARKYRQRLKPLNLNVEEEKIKFEGSRACRRRTVPVVGDTVPHSTRGQAPADGVLVEESTESLAITKDKSRPFLPSRCKAEDDGAPGHSAPSNLVNFDMNSATNKKVLFLLYNCFNMLRGAHAEDQLTENSKRVDSKVWERSDCAKVAMTILAVSIGGVGVAAWKMYNRRPTFTEDDINEGLSSGPAVPRRSDAAFENFPLIECPSDEE